MASFDVILEREAISGPTIDYSSFAKALFGSDIEGQQFLSTMKALPLSKCPVNSKKGNFDQLPASYKSWDKLDEKQLGNVQKFWSRLTPEIQDEVRQASAAAESMAMTAAHGGRQADYTTKHDKIRLLHLYSDPGAQVLWSRFRGVKDRAELDADNSHPFVGPVVDDAGQKLADLFNNRLIDESNMFQPQNVAVKYADGKVKKPFESANATIDQSVAALLGDLDPNESSRPLRNSDWIKKQMRLLFHDITKIWHDYTKSGLQAWRPFIKEGHLKLGVQLRSTVHPSGAVFCPHTSKMAV